MDIKKTLIVGVCSVTALVIGGLGLNSSSQADGFDKKERLEILKKEEQRLRAALDSRQPGASETTAEKLQREQDERLVKKIGIEAGTLQDELYPPDSKAILEENIRSLKNILEINGYYETKKNDPVNGETYEKAARILNEKKKTLAEIEHQLKDGSKPIEQLTKEFEELRAVREITINE
ncbi:hypothetical protein [Paenibacillus sp. GbtcB18]|uniref:hypothetical protein n=1 Tax=Paenibacillus sp. GbtcB18 TaxID=2824763 RepID=UPI001C2F9C7D|nr:hypothetical protein [Paenibacillus sp. GbtcB18]